jgi:hypothetical protein
MRKGKRMPKINPSGLEDQLIFILRQYFRHKEALCLCSKSEIGEMISPQDKASRRLHCSRDADCSNWST